MDRNMTERSVEHPRNQQPRERSQAARKLSPETAQYLRFGGMIATSTVAMLLLTYTNVWAPAHIRWSEERLYMSLLMGSVMGIIMFGFMWGMHKNTRVNVGIIIGCLALAFVAFLLSRSQYFVDDQDYMRGMIPHHSIAILTSERADIEDVRVRELADGIIMTQEREIKEMDWLIEDISKNGPATTDAEARERPVPEFQGQQ